jgi:hypothetical protein
LIRHARKRTARRVSKEALPITAVARGTRSGASKNRPVQQLVGDDCISVMYTANDHVTRMN